MRRTAVSLGLFSLLGLLFLAPVRSEEKKKPEPAQTIMDAATRKAKADKKPVFVIFHATWCGWCKHLEAVLALPEFKKMFADNYIMITLDVMETAEKKATDENPGGDKIMAALGGAKSGLPFYAIIDAKGKKLADSNAMPKGANIGYPAEPAEIEAFARILKDTAPKWAEADRAKLIDYLKKKSPANHPTPAQGGAGQTTDKP